MICSSGSALTENSEDVCSDIEWMRRSDVRRICGVGKDLLDAWVSDEKVEAHKLHGGKNGTVVFSASDIRRAIAGSPKYVPGSFTDDEK